MKLRKKTFFPALLAASMAVAAGPAYASVPKANTTITASVPATRHASLRIETGRARAPWVGEAVPVTVTAAFRDVDQVTLEGPLRVTSPHVVTTSFPSEPKQWQERIGGVPTLLVRWTGVVTPATAGPLDLTAELSVRVGFREPVKVEARASTPLPQDLFGDDDDVDPFRDPFGSAMFRRMEEQMRRMQKDLFEAEAGPIHEEAATLSAKAPSLEARALPAAGRPPTFGGAVGRFDVSSSLATGDLRQSDPVTLRIVVEGEGDLDRVDVPGVATSSNWKAYPPRAIPPGPARPGSRAQKVFEQTLVPLVAGSLTVPSVELAAFDPQASAYVTRASAPITVTVAPGASPAPEPAPSVVPPPPPARRWRALWILPPLAIVAALVALVLLFARRRARARGVEAKLRRKMRSAAAQGALAPFAEAARDLIRARLATRWGIPAEAVTTRTIRERLGDGAKPLVEALALDSALRFGGGRTGERDLASLGAEVESALARAV